MEDSGRISFKMTPVWPNGLLKAYYFITLHSHLIAYKYCLDIDECATMTHSCHVNAYCNNTLGSHNCTCHAGYTGNGRNCSGN